VVATATIYWNMAACCGEGVGISMIFSYSRCRPFLQGRDGTGRVVTRIADHSVWLALQVAQRREEEIGDDFDEYFKSEDDENDLQFNEGL
jgi:hypothetical protein